MVSESLLGSLVLPYIEWGLSPLKFYVEENIEVVHCWSVQDEHAVTHLRVHMRAAISKPGEDDRRQNSQRPDEHRIRGTGRLVSI